MGDNEYGGGDGDQEHQDHHEQGENNRVLSFYELSLIFVIAGEGDEDWGDDGGWGEDGPGGFRGRGGWRGPRGRGMRGFGRGFGPPGRGFGRGFGPGILNSTNNRACEDPYLILQGLSQEEEDLDREDLLQVAGTPAGDLLCHHQG